MNKKMMILLIGILLFIPLKVNARRGCCSHHGGVSGCSSSGRQICNDGTLSPSCTCTPVINYTYGCTDKTAINYDVNADRDDGSCKYYTYGCTDKTAINYDVNADRDDGNCKYYTYGCTDKTAINYDVNADRDDGSCKYYTYGCTDKTAINYDVNADRDDGSCKYYTYETVINYDNNANKNDESYQFLTSSNLDEDADYKNNNNSIISGVIFEVLVVSGFLFLLKKINR